jgi:hypothetical protein
MKPHLLKLSISTPQPRLNEIFYLQLDVTDLKRDIFGELAADIEPKREVINPKNGKKQIRINTQMLEKTAIRLNKTAFEKGKFEAGPLVFELNGTKYTTNKISYEVIDSLPDIDNGLWIRKIVVDDKTVCIIIEQRTPVKIIRTKTKYGTTHIASERPVIPVVNINPVLFNPVPGLKHQNGHSGSGVFNMGEEDLIDGNTKSYSHSYSISYFEITEPKASIKLTKENFENMPEGYEFEDIAIQ